MFRERALKVVLIVVGSLFLAGIYPITVILWRRDKPVYTDAMLLSVYVSLGILLLIAVRNPSAHRSLIAFSGWSCFAQAAIMAVIAFRDVGEAEVLGMALLIIVGAPLLVLAPAKENEPSGS